MILKMKPKKILEPGIHLVTIKDISVVRDSNGKPVSWLDPDDGNAPAGMQRVLFMGKSQFGIEADFWTGKSHIPRINALCEAIKVTRPVHKDAVVGQKLFIMVMQCYLFDNGVPRLDAEGKHQYQSKVVHRFWVAGERPSVKGNPQDNDGVASGDFLWHYDNGKYFQPIPQQETLAEETKIERFGE